jgi:hypothetical protein
MHVSSPLQLAEFILPYLLLFAAPSIMALATSPPRHQVAIRNPLLVLFFSGLVLFIGLRFWVGGDWEPYLKRLVGAEEMTFWDAVTGRDPAYQALTWISSHAGLWIYGVNTACALIFCWGLGSICQRQPNPWLAVAVAIPFFVIVVGMGYTRQSVAVGLVMVAFARVSDGRVWQAIGFVLIGAVFHKSAPIVLPFIVLAHWRDPRIRALFIFAAGVLCSIALWAEWSRIQQLYLEDGTNSKGTLVRLLMNVLPALAFLVLRRRMGFGAAEERLWFWVSLATLVVPLTLAFAPASTPVDRAAVYLIPLQIAVLSRLPYALPAPPRLTVAAIIAYSLLVMLVWLGGSHYSAWWFPYQNALLNPGDTPLWVELGLKPSLFWER